MYVRGVCVCVRVCVCARARACVRACVCNVFDLFLLTFFTYV